MAYSQMEQENLDLDLFFKDSEKQIHVATGGGQIPLKLSEIDISVENFKQDTLDSIIEEYEIIINTNLSEIIGLDGKELITYLTDFVSFAKKGFYTYDKTKLGDFKDNTFHLVAKPKLKITTFNKLEHFSIKLPDDFLVFNLLNYFSE